MNARRDQQRRAFRVTGRVQGVGFRWFVRHAAQGLGLRGTVRNLPDGSVEVVAEGPAERLEELAAKLAMGPPTAVVNDVGEAALPAGDLPEDFRIIR